MLAHLISVIYNTPDFFPLPLSSPNGSIYPHTFSSCCVPVFFHILTTVPVKKAHLGKVGQMKRTLLTHWERTKFHMQIYFFETFQRDCPEMVWIISYVHFGRVSSPSFSRAFFWPSAGIICSYLGFTISHAHMAQYLIGQSWGLCVCLCSHRCLESESHNVKKMCFQFNQERD